MPHPVMPGAEPWTHVSDVPGPGVGALLLHGFTGSPSSMRGLAGHLAAAGFHVELPCLPGHGTVVDEMVHTDWNDWTGEAARAHERLATRADKVVVVGQSMGGALALWTALQVPELAGIVCINPVVVPQPPEVIEMLGELLDDGMEVVPGTGPDIADPDGTDVSYEGTPVRPLLSLLNDGLAPITGRFHELTVPLRLFTSRQDHVVEPANSEHLAATYGGEVDHTWLERSFHVATQDHDRDLICAETLAFATRVVAA
jgi:carboxylesterase